MFNVIQLGLGPIGQQLTRYLHEREGIAIVGAVDPDPEKVGKDVGAHAGLAEFGVCISPELGTIETDKLEAADVALISTLSSIEKVEQQITKAASYGLDIVSSCEELVHPWTTAPKCAKRIDHVCTQQEVSCLGTGVNPGFLMDYLPAVLTSVCREVNHIKVERFQDATPRRQPFQEKIGVGLTVDEFEMNRHSIRHVGLEESVEMIADTMSWELDRVCETLTPVMANTNITNGSVQVDARKVAGVQQVARGYIAEKEVITLIFKAAIGLDEPHDTVHIYGVPEFSSTIPGGINGDIATSAIIVNALRSVKAATPGLKTMLDIQVPSYYCQWV